MQCTPFFDASDDRTAATTMRVRAPPCVRYDNSNNADMVMRDGDAGRHALHALARSGSVYVDELHATLLWWLDDEDSASDNDGSNSSNNNVRDKQLHVLGVNADASGLPTRCYGSSDDAAARCRSCDCCTSRLLSVSVTPPCDNNDNDKASGALLACGLVRQAARYGVVFALTWLRRDGVAAFVRIALRRDESAKQAQQQQQSSSSSSLLLLTAETAVQWCAPCTRVLQAFCSSSSNNDDARNAHARQQQQSCEQRSHDDGAVSACVLAQVPQESTHAADTVAVYVLTNGQSVWRVCVSVHGAVTTQEALRDDARRDHVGALCRAQLQRCAADDDDDDDDKNSCGDDYKHGNRSSYNNSSTDMTSEDELLALYNNDENNNNSDGARGDGGAGGWLTRWRLLCRNMGIGSSNNNNNNNRSASSGYSRAHTTSTSSFCAPTRRYLAMAAVQDTSYVVLLRWTGMLELYTSTLAPVDYMAAALLDAQLPLPHLAHERVRSNTSSHDDDNKKSTYDVGAVQLWATHDARSNTVHVVTCIECCTTNTTSTTNTTRGDAACAVRCYWSWLPQVQCSANGRIALRCSCRLAAPVVADDRTTTTTATTAAILSAQAPATHNGAVALAPRSCAMLLAHEHTSSNSSNSSSQSPQPCLLLVWAARPQPLPPLSSSSSSSSFLRDAHTTPTAASSTVLLQMVRATRTGGSSGHGVVVRCSASQYYRCIQQQEQCGNGRSGSRRDVAPACRVVAVTTQPHSRLRRRAMGSFVLLDTHRGCCRAHVLHSNNDDDDDDSSDNTTDALAQLVATSATALLASHSDDDSDSDDGDDDSDDGNAFVCDTTTTTRGCDNTNNNNDDSKLCGLVSSAAAARAHVTAARVAASSPSLCLVRLDDRDDDDHNTRQRQRQAQHASLPPRVTRAFAAGLALANTTTRASRRLRRLLCDVWCAGTSSSSATATTTATLLARAAQQLRLDAQLGGYVVPHRALTVHDVYAAVLAATRPTPRQPSSLDSNNDNDNDNNAKCDSNGDAATTLCGASDVFVSYRVRDALRARVTLLVVTYIAWAVTTTIADDDDDADGDDNGDDDTGGATATAAAERQGATDALLQTLHLLLCIGGVAQMLGTRLVAFAAMAADDNDNNDTTRSVVQRTLAAVLPPPPPPMTMPRRQGSAHNDDDDSARAAVTLYALRMAHALQQLQQRYCNIDKRNRVVCMRACAMWTRALQSRVPLLHHMALRSDLDGGVACSAATWLRRCHAICAQLTSSSSTTTRRATASLCGRVLLDDGLLLPLTRPRRASSSSLSSHVRTPHDDDDGDSNGDVDGQVTTERRLLRTALRHLLQPQHDATMTMTAQQQKQQQHDDVLPAHDGSVCAALYLAGVLRRVVCIDTMRLHAPVDVVQTYLYTQLVALLQTLRAYNTDNDNNDNDDNEEERDGGTTTASTALRLRSDAWRVLYTTLQTLQLDTCICLAYNALAKRAYDVCLRYVQDVFALAHEQQQQHAMASGVAADAAAAARDAQQHVTTLLTRLVHVACAASSSSSSSFADAQRALTCLTTTPLSDARLGTLLVRRWCAHVTQLLLLSSSQQQPQPLNDAAACTVIDNSDDDSSRRNALLRGSAATERRAVMSFFAYLMAQHAYGQCASVLVRLACIRRGATTTTVTTTSRYDDTHTSTQQQQQQHDAMTTGELVALALQAAEQMCDASSSTTTMATTTTATANDDDDTCTTHMHTTTTTRADAAVDDTSLLTSADVPWLRRLAYQAYCERLLRQRRRRGDGSLDNNNNNSCNSNSCSWSDAWQRGLPPSVVAVATRRLAEALMRARRWYAAFRYTMLVQREHDAHATTPQQQQQQQQQLVQAHAQRAGDDGDMGDVCAVLQAWVVDWLRRRRARCHTHAPSSSLCRHHDHMAGRDDRNDDNDNDDVSDDDDDDNSDDDDDDSDGLKSEWRTLLACCDEAAASATTGFASYRYTLYAALTCDYVHTPAALCARLRRADAYAALTTLLAVCTTLREANTTHDDNDDDDDDDDDEQTQRPSSRAPSSSPPPLASWYAWNDAAQLAIELLDAQQQQQPSHTLLVTAGVLDPLALYARELLRMPRVRDDDDATAAALDRAHARAHAEALLRRLSR